VSKEKKNSKYLGMPHIKGEGAPLHPDDLDCDMTDEQYQIQLKAYNDYWKVKE
jgi:hypothetical protein